MDADAKAGQATLINAGGTWPARLELMRVWAVLLSVGLTATGAWAAAGGPPDPFFELVGDFGAHGLDFEDLPDPLMVHVADLASGALWQEARPRDAFLREVASLSDVSHGGTRPDGAVDAHRVVGQVSHWCLDFHGRPCYRFYTNTLGPSVETRLDELQWHFDWIHREISGPYGRVPGAPAFPLHGATALYVQGVYDVGAHEAGLVSVGETPGPHADRAMRGAGVGRVSFVDYGHWGISFGVLRAHGVWTFCDTEDDPACAAP